MAEWKDVTSHSQRTPPEERVPRSWSLQCGWLSILVHHHIHYDPDQWLLSCNPFFKHHELQSPGAEAAQEEAVGLVLQKLSDTIKDLQKAAK